jgi:hypothetical protein
MNEEPLEDSDPILCDYCGRRTTAFWVEDDRIICIGCAACEDASLSS